MTNRKAVGLAAAILAAFACIPIALHFVAIFTADYAAANKIAVTSEVDGLYVVNGSGTTWEACLVTVNGAYTQRGTLYPNGHYFAWDDFSTDSGLRFSFEARAVKRVLIDCKEPRRLYVVRDW